MSTKRWHKLNTLVDDLKTEMHRELQALVGSEVWFITGNMSAPVRATVIWANWDRIGVRNERTGKTRRLLPGDAWTEE